MDRLSIVLTLAVGAVITGGLVTLMLWLGFFNWIAIGIAAAIGFGLSWPASYVVSRRIKRDDPDWDDSRIERVDSPVPDPRDPEV